MIELFLDNKPAVLRDNVSIKLTRENVYFTKSGSYTYDIELPLGCAENRAIFGNINRKDVETHYREFRAILRVDNQVLLDGKAILHQVTDTAAKVQLMGGNAEMNFYTKAADLYVDELDLGDWFSLMVWRPEPEHHKGNAFLLLDQEHKDNYPMGYDHITAYMGWTARWWANTEGQAANSATDKGVMFPVINETASYKEGTNNAEANNLEGGGVIVNGYILRLDATDERQIYYPEFRYSWPNGGNSTTPQVIPSFQPMLLMMLSKVLQAAGYPLDMDSEAKLLSNSFARHIFIVTANNRLELNKAMPHWTVNEFITQVEHLLGLVIEVNEQSKKSCVTWRNEYWADDAVTTVIDKVVDEYSVEIDKNDTTDISNGNVGFDGLVDDYLHLSDDITESVDIDKTRFASFVSMQTALANGRIGKNDKGKIFEVQGHQFIVIGDDGAYEFKEVNQLRMLRRNPNKRDADITLKIVPCPITKWDCPLIRTTKIWEPISGSYGYHDDAIGSVKVDVYTRPDIAHIGSDTVSTDEGTDIEALIEGYQDIDQGDTNEDLLYIGILPSFGDLNEDNIKYYWPRPIAVHHWSITATSINSGCPDRQHNFLVLNETTSNAADKSLYSESLNAQHIIDTTVKQCIKFIHYGALSPGGVFIIHGQRFACEKLEYTITSKGMSPLVTGYFYRLS